MRKKKVLRIAYCEFQLPLSAFFPFPFLSLHGLLSRQLEFAYPSSISLVPLLVAPARYPTHPSTLSVITQSRRISSLSREAEADSLCFPSPNGLSGRSKWGSGTARCTRFSFYSLVGELTIGAGLRLPV